MIGPVFKKLAEKPEFSGVEFYTVDVDEQPSIMDEVQISSVRSVAIFAFFFRVVTPQVDAHVPRV